MLVRGPPLSRPGSCEGWARPVGTPSPGPRSQLGPPRPSGRYWMGNGSICLVGRRARPSPARAPAGPGSDPCLARPARPAGPGLPLPNPTHTLCRARLATPGPKRPNQQVEERGGPGEEKTGPANRPARARLRHIGRPAHSQPGPDRRVCRACFARGGPGEEKTGPAKARSAARERPLLTRPGPAPLTSGAPVISGGFLVPYTVLSFTHVMRVPVLIAKNLSLSAGRGRVRRQRGWRRRRRRRRRRPRNVSTLIPVAANQWACSPVPGSIACS